MRLLNLKNISLSIILTIFTVLLFKYLLPAANGTTETEQPSITANEDMALVKPEADSPPLLNNLYLPKPETFKPYPERKLLKGKYLQAVGGFTIPRIKIGKTYHRSIQLDFLPGSNKWVTGHSAGYVIELIEPEQIGIGAPETWPTLKVARKQPALQDIRKITASGVLWLNEDEVLTSGRKSYRSGFEPKWLAKVNLATGTEIQYTITSESNTKNDNFHMLQALGGGFMRLTDKEWSKKYLNGIGFLLGKGGYDVLGSPLGPALGYWEMDNKPPRILLDYPHNKQPATRDPYYFYPEKDPNTSHLAHIPMWKHPQGDTGYWQAGSVGGLTFINHPEVKGVLATHNFGRGLHDYRAQGDLGSIRYFLVQRPEIFYTERGLGRRNDRGNHSKEIANSTYPEGILAHAGRVFDPDALVEVYNNKKKPWETQLSQFEWPDSGLKWDVSSKNPTVVGSVTWDNQRQLLWAAIGDRKQAKLVAYKIIVDDDRPDIPMNLPDQWLEYHNERNAQNLK
ncbi:hypothetical protein [Paraglaciecola sp.]|uniref:hypothetical protein n=1 Tax=Paraglaciecola sp. TaxID=1920173 RepID=UPI003263D045